MKKKSKAPYIILCLVGLVLIAAIVNLFMAISSGESLVMSIGVAVAMLFVFIMCLRTALKDIKKMKSSDDEGDDEDSEDDD